MLLSNLISNLRIYFYYSISSILANNSLSTRKNRSTYRSITLEALDYNIDL